MSKAIDKQFEVFDDNQERILLEVRDPEFDEYEASKRVYAEKVSELIKTSSNKLLLRSQLEDWLEETGVWSQKDQDKIDQLRTEIHDLYKKLNKGNIKLSEAREFAIQMAEKRGKMAQIMIKRQTFDDATVEAIAEQEQKDYLVFACTYIVGEEKRYWDTFEDCKYDKLNPVYRQAMLRVNNYIYNIDPEIEKQLPENKFLLKYGFVDENMNFIDRKTKVPVDRHGTPLTEVEQKNRNIIETYVGEIEPEQPFIED